MKTISAILLCLFCASALSQSTNRFPLNRAFLQTDLNGSGKKGTNFDTLSASNFLNAATGLPLSTGGGGNQSPWTNDINAAKHTLTNGQADATFTLPAASVTNFYLAIASGQLPLSALTNFSASMTGSNYANASTVVSNNFGRATNLTVVSTSSTATNVFHTYGFADQLANGIWYQTRVDAGTHIRIYTNITGYSLAVDTNAGTYLDNHYEIVNNTNGTPDNWNLAAVAIAYSVDGTNTWDAGGTGLLLSPQPWQTGYGLYYPAIYGDGAGLTNINATVNNLMTSGGLAGTLSNKFIHIRSDGMTINNTNWIQSGGVSGGMATITNGGFTIYSTNHAFSNVRQFDQLLFTGVSIQIIVHTVVNDNTIIGWQINAPDEGLYTSTAAYSTNWFLIPSLFGATDYTVGAENRIMRMDSNNSFRFVGIGNQGVVAFHHNSNGTAMQLGISTSPLAGLQMGPNGVYFCIGSVGSNFVNAVQWVLPSETLREAMVFSTNGAVTFQYGLTNIKGGNIEFRSKAVAVAGFEGNGSGISNVVALKATNTFGALSYDSATGNFTNGAGNAVMTSAGVIQAGFLSGTAPIAAVALSVAAGAITGTMLDSQLSSNVGLLNRNPQTWTGSNHIAGAFEGSGILVTNLNASQLATGLIPAARLAGSAGTSSIALGQSADSTKDYAVSIGAGASAFGTNSTAMGRSTAATASNASAFGEGAQAGNADATAIGQNAVTTATNQIMLGLANGTVNVPGSLVASGASLTSLPAGQLTGSIADARLSANVALLNANNVFTGGSNAFTGIVNFLSNAIMATLNVTTATFTNATFANAINVAGAGSFSNHTDVKITGTAPAAGDILAWNGATKWTNGPAPSGGGSSFPLAGDANFNTFNPTNFTQAIGKQGSAGAPTYTAAGITDTGIYFIGDPEIDFSIGGSRKVAIDRFGELIATHDIVLNNVITISTASSLLTWNAGSVTYPIPAIQAGHTNVTTGTSVVITFPVVMPSTNYTALCTSVGASLAGYFPSGKTVNGFTANFTIITASDIDWQVIQHTQ